MTKKYQVFISSTQDDLKGERRELARIIAEMGHIPVYLETFSQDDLNQRRFIKKSIAESDYFLALLARRPGSPGEYTQAVKNGIPVIGLVMEQKARKKPRKRAAQEEADPAALKTLETFRRKLRTHPHLLWTSPADLRQKVQPLLTREMSLNPRPGWVPGTEAAGGAVANLLARLSVENEDLKARIRLHSGGGAGELRERMKKTLKILALNKVALSFYYETGDNWENARQFSCLRVFRLLAPLLAPSPGKTTADIARFLGKVLNPEPGKPLRGDYPAPANAVRKVMTDFSILKLIRRSSGGEHWESTDYGKELYAAYRMRQLERVLIKKTAP